MQLLCLLLVQLFPNRTRIHVITYTNSLSLLYSEDFINAGLCSWAINIVRFYEVFCDVEPKRKALAAANAELAAAQEKLTKIKAKIKVSAVVKVLYS